MVEPVKAETPPAIPWADFLREQPPTTSAAVTECAWRQGVGAPWRILAPDLELRCDAETCDGVRFFECTKQTGGDYLGDKVSKCYLTYRCKNCEQEFKIFAVLLCLTDDQGNGHAVKMGESPPFGPHVPPRVLKLVGPDAELFNKGRRAESHGLGIGAMTYYRRVVENQTDRLIDEIIKVARRTGYEAVVPALEAAKNQKEFSRAVDMVKDAIPPTLLIDGHNPLTLLHSALSHRLHEESDARCLELAGDVREVLGALAERISQALKDHAQLKESVGRLMQGRKPKPEAPGAS